MSPIGGIGVNLAIQDAVATANVLVPILKKRMPNIQDLAKIQKRRLFPTKFTQFIQVMIQNKSVQPFLNQQTKQGAPSILKLFHWFPFLKKYPAKFIGIGIRPEQLEL